MLNAKKKKKRKNKTNENDNFVVKIILVLGGFLFEVVASEAKLSKSNNREGECSVSA